ncbi:LOW QUALITY PROTEIN: pleiotropic drug resistance protein 3-like [Carica papaya]|uniref:LOW QUALITY PROTEIN: pleiotropic drug resistance protein 3-like n=1 Tax=Carica papaya TaxID=3649 RepID=UPI000B8C6E0D|nr:LOW QUALITY PROTEIN: pleiotropic drug resistance protein 3-like [Carica papaya]
MHDKAQVISRLCSFIWLVYKLQMLFIIVGVELPTVEVRYKNLLVEAECEVVEGKPLPTLWNSLKRVLSELLKLLGAKRQEAKIRILDDVSGIIKPGRMTLLLGPPGSGKTSLLKSLSGNLDKSLKFTGEISYNGCMLEEFVPQKTSAYISQYDLHIAEMTVRETLDFSARCQGVGSRTDIMMEISRREKEKGIVPDPDIDTYMKAISVKGLKETLQTDYILKILGLDICADTLVGNAMRRGISGGQKKRLTTGEMIVGPTKALFMDEITNGLDSSTAFQIVTSLKQLVHITDATLLVSLLQPAPETYDLFDDIIIMAEGKIVYHGPRNQVLEFFEDCGFRCPERKGVADFLQEVNDSETLTLFGISRFFCHFLLLFSVHLTSISMFRFLAAVFQTVVVSMTAGSFAILFVLLFSGFIIPQPSMPVWLRWGFWVSPITYGEIGLSVNEFLAPRWQKMLSTNTTIGKETLETRGLNFDGYLFWISIGALFGFTLVFNIGFTIALTFLKSPTSSRAMISQEKLSLVKIQFIFSDLNDPLTLFLLHRNNKELVMQASVPAPGSRDLHFPNRFSQNSWEQFKSCLWKLHLSYWRSPSYNLMRILHTFISSLLFGILFWKQGQKIENQQNLFNILGSMYASVTFLGINNCSSVLPYIARERTVMYREKFAGMYSPWTYALAQVMIEMPYLFIETVEFVIITYPMIGYYGSAYKVFWYFYSVFCALLSFNYLGMLLVSLTPNELMAAILSSAFYTIFNLFAGFLIPQPQIPKWWIWLYYLAPTSWILNGLLTSQYGDIEKEILVFGETKSVAAFLEDQFGFRHNHLPITAVVLALFPLVFASLFAYCIGRLDFQRR